MRKLLELIPIFNKVARESQQVRKIYNQIVPVESKPLNLSTFIWDIDDEINQMTEDFENKSSNASILYGTCVDFIKDKIKNKNE